MESIILIVIGLALFEIINSIDNAIINAEVLGTMSARSKRWFLTWGLFIAVFMVRGLLPWLIVWFSNPDLGFIQSFTATFSSDPLVAHSMETSKPILLGAGGTFLIFLFFHWLFVEPKTYGLKGERFIHSQASWFFAVVSIILTTLVWFGLKINPLLAFGIVVGSTAFFITHGFKEQAEKSEKELMESKSSDLSKILYLEVIDATFSIDGVLGAFAFTLSVPLIILGNGLGAIVLRKLTMGNIENIKKYVYLKNGAMYSIFALGLIMVSDAFGIEFPSYVSPLVTMAIVGYFFYASVVHLKRI